MIITCSSCAYIPRTSALVQSSLPQVLAVISDAVQQLVYARRTFVYLADQARQELWLTQPEDSSAGYINSRSKLGQGLLGTCGLQHKQVCEMRHFSLGITDLHMCIGMLCMLHLDVEHVASAHLLHASTLHCC